MRDPLTPAVIRREDYRVPAFLVDSVDLHVDIRDAFTRVTAELSIRRNPASDERDAPLRLDGEDILLRDIAIDGLALEAEDYLLESRALVVPRVADTFRLRTVGDIDPAANTALEGLYVSHGMYCTQCEAEGFRRITWFPDRPDVLARFRTTVEADRQQLPLLLSNGNRVSHEVLPEGRHRATWVDPFPKPCYLFALVAGDLACREDVFVTRSGRHVTLQVFVEPHDIDKTEHALESLKRAMRWDEEVFGCEYDLDVYMIVAVSHFNMGAMENKGLNVFNTSCVLANHRTQTDRAFQRVEAVVAHEYFHNWSGNRVTCRDWFQLSLKEGFTVYRDSEFSKDMHSRTVKRIEEVNFLRTVQFPEDAGPLAHPIRPDSYVEINNFYTATVYEKGAEVVRLLETLLGREAFLRGCRLYFDRHDGQAATCEDFIRAMEDATGRELSQFRRWYSQAGTPEVGVEGTHDAARAQYRLRFRQSCPPSPGQPGKQAQVMPVRMGLLDASSGAPLALHCDDPRFVVDGSGGLFVLDAPEAELVFEGVDAPALPSLLRGFSAPVKLHFPFADDELAFLARYDGDDFNRWQSGQELALRCLLAATATVQRGEPVTLPAVLHGHYAALLGDDHDDQAFVAEMLALPSESFIADQFAQADPAAIHVARQSLRRALVGALRPALVARLASCAPRGAWSPAPEDIGRRALHGALLELLCAFPDDALSMRVEALYRQADNMTDQVAAFRAALHGNLPIAQPLCADFYRQWRDEALVIDSWFSLQVTNPSVDALARAGELLAHPDFELTNPNRARALVGAFASGNPAQFHRADGAGYRFLAAQLLALDAVNPQIAARLAGAFSRWRRLVPSLQSHAAAALDGLLSGEKLSPNLYEVVKKTREAPGD